MVTELTAGVSDDTSRDLAATRRSIAWVLVAYIATSVILVKVALDRGQDWSFDSHSYHNVYAYASMFERQRLGYPMSLGAYFNPLLDAPLGWGVRHLHPKLVTTLIACFQAVAVTGAALLPWHCLTGRVSPGADRLRAARTPLWWGALYAVSALIAYGSMSRIQLGATWGDLTSVAPVMVGLHVLVRWTRGGQGRSLHVAGALLGVAVGLKYTNGPSALAALSFVAAVTYRRRDRASWWVAADATIRMCLAICAGFLAAAGVWSTTLTIRFGNPIFPFGGRSLNSELGTASGGYVDLARTRFPVRDVVDLVTIPVKLLRLGTRVTELPVRDPRLFASMCSIAVIAVVALIRRQRVVPEAGIGSVRAIAVPMAAFLVVHYLAWGYLFGNGRYLELVELLTPTIVCLATAYASSQIKWLGHRVRVSTVQPATAVGLACTLIVSSLLTVSPDYGHQPFGDRWYELDTSHLPSLDDAMVVVPYEFEPLDFAEFALAPRQFARLHSVLIPTRLGQREIDRVADFDGTIYSFQYSDAGDTNLAAAGLRRVGQCFDVRGSQRVTYKLCRLERIG